MAGLQKLVVHEGSGEYAQFKSFPAVIYNLSERVVELRWREESIMQTFENFEEVERLITLKEAKNDLQ